jgi:transketolase
VAADSVQKVGNGYPGDGDELGGSRVPAVQKGHAARPDGYALAEGGPVPAVPLSHHLTPYLQLRLGGFGLELEDVKALRIWAPGPRHPEYSNTRRTESTAGPLGKGLANVVGVAMASRDEGGVLAARALLAYPLTQEAA